MTTEPKVCSWCILPGTYPGIIFDENGEFNVCKVYDKYYPNIDYVQK